MGHDVIAIGNRQLDTASFQRTAEHLYHLLQEPIAYGYIDDWYNWKTHEEGTYEFVEQGRFGPPGVACRRLVDELYMDRHYYHKPDKGEMSYSCSGPTEADSDFDICHDSFYFHLPFDSRWWNFVRYFQGKFAGDEGWESYIRKYRTSVWKQVRLLGGTTAIYGDDQGPSQFIGEMILTHPFEEVKQKVLTDFGQSILDVPSFQRNDQQVSYQESWWLAFVDDFSDLPENEIGYPSLASVPK